MIFGVWVRTSEDIKALIVGPTRVLIIICFSSSAHIVRHLRRVSGSFCKNRKPKHVKIFTLISYHKVFQHFEEIAMVLPLCLCTFSVRASLSAGWLLSAISWMIWFLWFSSSVMESFSSAARLNSWAVIQSSRVCLASKIRTFTSASYMVDINERWEGHSLGKIHSREFLSRWATAPPTQQQQLRLWDRLQASRGYFTQKQRTGSGKREREQVHRMDQS